MHSIKTAILASSFCCVGLPALADCAFPTFSYFPDKNDFVVVEAAVSAGTFCRHNFAEGPGYHFTKLTVGKPPEHGTLRRRGNAFVYTPAKSFKGKDAYIIYICARKDGGGNGCSTVAYVSTTQ
jgi:hypothetical protein